MARFDDSACELPSPGLYFVEIVSSVEKVTKKPPNDSYFLIGLIDVDTGKKLCEDIIMLSGRGARMGANALGAFGKEIKKGDQIVPGEMLGLRAYAAVHHETYEGQQRAKVEKFCEGSSAGYWPETWPPDGYKKPVKPEAATGQLTLDDDPDSGTPF